MAQLLLGDGVGVVNLVAQDDKGHLLELLHRQEGVELGLGLGEALVVLGVNQEDYAVNLGEVVLPKTAGYNSVEMLVTSPMSHTLVEGGFSCRVSRTLLVTTEIEGCESHVANSELLGSCDSVSMCPRACRRRLLQNNILGCRVGCRMATRSFCESRHVSTSLY